jgi:hypothetical protein
VTVRARAHQCAVTAHRESRRHDDSHTAMAPTTRSQSRSSHPTSQDVAVAAGATHHPVDDGGPQNPLRAAWPQLLLALAGWLLAVTVWWAAGTVAWTDGGPPREP